MNFTNTAVYPLQVQFEDLDFGGVVHHPNYLRFLERARNDAMRQSGYPFTRFLKEGHVFVVAEVQAKFVRPALPDASLFVLTRTVAARRSSLKVFQAITTCVPTPEELAAPTAAFFAARDQLFMAQLRLVCVCMHEFKPAAVPEEVRRHLGLVDSKKSSLELGASKGALGTQDVRLLPVWG